MAAQEQILNGRYRLEAQLAAGGMAVVYRAFDLALSRQVALKILRPSLTNDAEFLRRFRQEARNVANLSHPNIVTVHDVGEEHDVYYIVMEFIDGQDLKRLIRSSAPLSIERVLNISIQMCAGLGYAHRANFVHADVKPQNMLMANSEIEGVDIVKVTDFGIAQALNAQTSERTGIVWGTPQYFSPEQARGEPPTPASDIYSIGVVMYEMLTGKLPYNGSSQEELALAHLRNPVPPVRQENPKVPMELDQIIQRAMGKEPSTRYRDADQLARLLINYTKQLANVRPPTVEPSASQAAPANSANTVFTSGGPKANPQPYPGATGGNKPGQAFQPSGKSAPVSGSPYVQTRPPGTGPLMPPNQAAGSPLPPAGANQPYRQNPPAQSGYTPPPANPMGAPLPPNQANYNPQSGYTGGFSPYNPVGNTPQYPYGGTTNLSGATIVLGLFAFVAVFGLIILWLAVWSAYS
jgi:eukaryotic-like serine/threonine-protein kinase